MLSFLFQFCFVLFFRFVSQFCVSVFLVFCFVCFSFVLFVCFFRFVSQFCLSVFRFCFFCFSAFFLRWLGWYLIKPGRGLRSYCTL